MSCIEEFRESREQTHMHSAEPEPISEADTSRQPQIKIVEEKAATKPLDHNQPVGRDGDFWDSLCSIPEEYPSQVDEEGSGAREPSNDE